MVKIKYQLTTISSLIVSPRSNLAWYIDQDNSSLDQTNLAKLPSDFLKKDQLKVIYPFYQYGEYEEWSNTANYYLPGSSLKGALCEKLPNHANIMVDDILIPNDYIVLRNLFKVQYLKDLSKAKLDIFVDNLGVQMVKANDDKHHLYGELYLKEPEDMEKLINQANNSAMIKMRQMIKYLSMICKAEYKDDLKDILLDAITKLEALMQDKDVILLGGYKGLLHSMERNVMPLEDNENGAIFLDPETNLMHGLVRIRVVE